MTAYSIPLPFLLAHDAAWEALHYSYMLTLYPFRCVWILLRRSFLLSSPLILELLSALIAITWGIYILAWDWSVFGAYYPSIVSRLGSIPVWAAWFLLSGLAQLFLSTYSDRLWRAAGMGVHIFNWTFWALAMILGTPAPMPTFFMVWCALIPFVGHVMLLSGWSQDART